MEAIKVAIKVEEKLAVIKGLNSYGDHEVIIKPSELTEAQRLELAEVVSRRTGSRPTEICQRVEVIYPFCAEVDLSNVDLSDLGKAALAILDQRIELRQHLIQQVDLVLAQALAVIQETPVERFWEKSEYVPGNSSVACLKAYPAFKRVYPYPDSLVKALRQYVASDLTENKIIALAEYRNHAEIKQLLGEIRSWATDRNKLATEKAVEHRREMEKQREMEKEARKQEEKRQSEERAAARLASRSAWIAAHGSPSMQERWADELLPSSELKDAMREWLFRGIGDLPRYQRITADDVCVCEYGDGDVEFEVEDATELSEASYGVLKQIRQALAKLPDGATGVATPRLHKAECSRCEEKIERLSVKVTIEYHGEPFSREYAA